MKEILTNSTFFGVMISILAYESGLVVKKRWKKGIFNPLLISIVIVMGFLLLFDVDYEVYNNGAKYLSYLLTPATVCLAIPLYEQLELLKKYKNAVVAGIVSGVLTSLVSVLVMASIFELSHTEYVTLLPKSITTAIGMDVTKELGGIVAITAAVIIITGVLGNIIAETVCRVCRLTEPIARGIAIGSASHAVGTARAMEMGEIEGAIDRKSVV